MLGLGVYGTAVSLTLLPLEEVEASRGRGRPLLGYAEPHRSRLGILGMNYCFGSF